MKEREIQVYLKDLLEYTNHNRNTHNTHFPKCLNKLMMFKLMFFPKTQVFNSQTHFTLAASELRAKGEEMVGY